MRVELRMDGTWLSLQLKWSWDWCASFMEHTVNQRLIPVQLAQINQPLAMNVIQWWVWVIESVPVSGYIWQNVVQSDRTGGPFPKSKEIEKLRVFGMLKKGEGGPSLVIHNVCKYADCCLESGKINARSKEPTLICGVTFQ